MDLSTVGDPAQLPTFLLIGAAKSGTSSLYAYLRQHPQVFMSARKEPNFFAFADRPFPYRLPRAPYRPGNRVITPLARYQALFAEARPEQARGEASHLYLTLAEPSCAAIRRLVPQARLVAVLRHPADRAFSHYLMQRGRGLEPLSFSAALAAEPARRAQGWDPDWWYGETGRYGAHLAVYRRHFPAEQMLILLYDDLVQDLPGALARIFAFIDVDPTFVPDLAVRRNVSFGVRSYPLQTLLSHLQRLRRIRLGALYALAWRATACNRTPPPPIPPADRQALTASHRADILALQESIGRDLSHWLTP